MGFETFFPLFGLLNRSFDGPIYLQKELSRVLEPPFAGK